MADLNLNRLDGRQRLELQLKSICSSIFTSSLFYPISFTRTLIQLGHEPFPLERGKTYIFFGRNAYFLPNFYYYLNNFYLSHGFKTIYTGAVAGILLKIFSSSGDFVISNILDRYYPEVGGNIDDLRNKLSDLDAYQCFRIKLRDGIRRTINIVLCTIITRPFFVIASRQIAQLIGNEEKYALINPFQPLILIGSEEGLPGFFSGLMPSIVAGLISVWATISCSYVIDIACKKIERETENLDQQERELIQHTRFSLGYLIPLMVNTVRYPFEVCSTVMAVAGSGLLVSLLPYSPTFNHWSDAYDYLSPYEIRRGAKFFMREEKGPIRVGIDNKLYASKKHFI